MTLSQWIINYRQSHSLSCREFAKLTSLSPQYVSILEHGATPQGKPVSPTVQALDKIATATNTTLDCIIKMLSEDKDQEIILNHSPLPRDLISDLASMQKAVEASTHPAAKEAAVFLKYALLSCTKAGVSRYFP